MKKINSFIATCAAAAVLSSCGGVGLIEYVKCFLNPGEYTTDECLTSKAIEAGTNVLEEYISGVDTLEEAESLASKMEYLRGLIDTAKGFGVEIPTKTKNAYNNALSRIRKHNYFGSPVLEKAMGNLSYM